MNLDWRLDERDGVTLVELVVTNATTTARRVRVGNRLDGPLWPPRREGVPEAGWDDGGFEGVVAADERLAVGYATPADPAEPPAEIVWTERAASAPADSELDIDSTPAGVVRSLGDARPPADAVPTRTPPVASASASDGEATDDVGADGGETGEGKADGGETGEKATEPGLDDGAADSASSLDEPLPDAVERWLATVEMRTERAESLASAATLSAATREVEATGGLPAVERLLAAVEDDREALTAVAEHATALRDRTETAADVPLDAFRRLS